MNLPPAADLRPLFVRYGLEPRAQGKRGTCSIFAVVGALEFEYARTGALRRRASSRVAAGGTRSASKVGA
jgi:hypothetical protein